MKSLCNMQRLLYMLFVLFLSICIFSLLNVQNYVEDIDIKYYHFTRLSFYKNYKPVFNIINNDFNKEFNKKFL